MQAFFITRQNALYDRGMQTGRPSKHPRSAFGTRLHAARETAGLTQSQVAEKLGLTQAAYALWERRDMALRPDQIEQVAGILKVSVEHLFGIAAPKTTSGPSGKIRKSFEEVSKLPRRKQDQIINVINALVTQAKEP